MFTDAYYFAMYAEYWDKQKNGDIIFNYIKSLHQHRQLYLKAKETQHLGQNFFLVDLRTHLL